MRAGGCRQRSLRTDLPGTYVHMTAALNLIHNGHSTIEGPVSRALGLSLLLLCPGAAAASRR